jgi:hypothetical protein
LVASECALERRAKSGKEVDLYRVDLRTGKAVRVNPPGCRVAEKGSVDDRPLVVIDDPAIGADGEAVIFSTGTCGTGLGLGDPHLFRRRGDGALEQLTSGFCVTGPPGPGGQLRGTTSFLAPPAVSRDGRTIGFGTYCDEFPGLTDTIERVFVYKDDPEPHHFEIFAQTPSIFSPLSWTQPVPSMDLAGTSLVVASNSTPGGCTSPGGEFQVYLARNLDDPIPGPSTCLCPGSSG